MKYWLFALIFLQSVGLKAQFLKSTKSFEPFSSIHCKIGGSQYLGELNELSSIKSIFLTRPVLGLSFQRRFTSKSKYSINLDLIQIAGDDFYSNDLKTFERNLRFSNSILSLESLIYFNPVAFAENFKTNNSVTLNFFLGLGIFYSNPKSISPLSGDKVFLRGLVTEGQGINSLYPEQYKSLVLTFPFGIEVEKKIAKRIQMSLGFCFVPTLSDYLDDVGGGVYPNPLLLPSDLSRVMSNRTSELSDITMSERRIDRFKELLALNNINEEPSQYISNLSQGGTQRGNSANLDHLFYFMGKLVLVIPDRIRCP